MCYQKYDLHILFLIGGLLTDTEHYYMYLPRIGKKVKGGFRAKKCVRRPPLKLKVYQEVAVQNPPKKSVSAKNKS